MKYPIRYIILSILLLLSVMLSFSIGSASLSAQELLGGLCGQSGYETERLILFSVRLPRLAAALIAGVGLAVSGVLLQNIMGNALASPNTIGVNAGAGLAAILSIAIFPGSVLLLPFAAFIGAFFTSLLILALSKKAGGGRATVVLAGIACTTFFQAIISFLTAIDTDLLSQYSAFSVGGFRGITADRLLLPALLVTLCLIASLFLANKLAILSLGDFIASSLGIRVGLMRTLLLLIASMSAAAVISYAGLLGFVGLVVPHITRRMMGAGIRHQLAGSALIGATLVLLSDLAGRLIFAPSEISVGIVMAFIGAPFFFVLLMKRRSYDA